MIGIQLTDAVTPPAIARFRLCLLACSYLVYSFLPTHTGIPSTNTKCLTYKKQNNLSPTYPN